MARSPRALARANVAVTPAADGGPELPRAADWHNPRVVQILDAAGRAFSRKGFASATMQDIADEAGITKSMIHYYFESKQALILELQAFIYDRYFQRVKQRLAEVKESTPGRAAAALGQAYEVVKDRQELRLNLELLAAGARDPALARRMALLQKRTRQLVAQAVLEVLGPDQRKVPVPPEVLGSLILAVLHGLRVQALMDSDEVIPQAAYDTFVASLLMAFKQLASSTSG